MTWNKPKKVITNTLVIVSILSLLFAALAIATLIVWKSNPKLVNKVDLKIPNFYVLKIDSLYAEMNKEKTLDGKSKYYKKIYNELSEITSLDRYYPQKQDTYKFLISFYKEKHQNNKALEMAKEWKESNPYDYEAKFYFADMLTLKSETLADEYYEKLYQSHSEIREVVKKYISFLLNTGKYQLASEIEKKYNKEYSLNLEGKYKLYFVDESNTNYSEKFSRDMQRTNPLREKSINLYTDNNFNLLSNLRFDVNNVPTGTTIKDLIIKIHAHDKVYETKFKIAHHLEQVNSSSYVTLGLDPFFYIEIPKELKKYQGNLSVEISLQLKSIITLVELWNERKEIK